MKDLFQHVGDVMTGCKPGNYTGRKIALVTDTGASKTLLNHNDWEKIKDNCKFVKHQRDLNRLEQHILILPIRGNARV